MNRNLNLRLWEAGELEENPQPGLHRGLCLRLSHVNNTPKPSDAFGSHMLFDLGAQLGDSNKAGMKEQVGGDDPFCQWIPASEVGHRSECGRGRKTKSQHEL